ncbi:hypothetical protein NHX12_001121, partial [Muraenolepis orangiensis]
GPPTTVISPRPGRRRKRGSDHTPMGYAIIDFRLFRSVRLDPHPQGSSMDRLINTLVSVICTEHCIVCKSYECRLKGQGAAIVETLELPDAQVGSLRGPQDPEAHDGPIRQLIIIQDYGDGEVSVDQTELEESAATTLQALAMAGQVAKLLHITEDGQLVAATGEAASGPAHLAAAGGTRYVVLESGGGGGAEGLRRVVAEAGHQGGSATESVTALDALLNAVSELGQREEVVEAGGGPGGVAVEQAQMPVPETQEVPAELRHDAPMLVPKVEEGQEAEGQEAEGQEAEGQEAEGQEAVQKSHSGMQEVVEFAASQMLKDGLKQVIINDKGTHYIVTELDDCTLQVEEAMFEEAPEEEPMAVTVTGEEVEEVELRQQPAPSLVAEQQPGGEVVVYLDGAPHKVVLEQ